MHETSEIRWGLAQRFEFIEWRAYWHGRLNRGDLEKEFDISTPQASVDLRNYQENAPGNIEYNATEKAYVATKNFHPEFLRLSPDRFLLQLHSIKTGALDQRETWFDVLPSATVTPAIARGPEAYTLRAILKAIRMRGEIQIYYRSLTNTRNRTIRPHSLAHDGFRWHVRAWCAERKEHRDYVLGRILSVFEPMPCSEESPDDIEWETYTKLILTPHPDLGDDQRLAVERDYRMDAGELALTLRVPLAFYFIRRYNLDLRNGEIPPERAQLFLKNYDEVLAAEKAAKDQAALVAEQRESGVSSGS